MIAIISVLDHAPAAVIVRRAGLWGITGMIRRGLEQLVRERRGRRLFVVLAIDVDGLKHVNDRHGHAARMRYMVADLGRLFDDETDVVA